MKVIVLSHLQPHKNCINTTEYSCPGQQNKAYRSVALTYKEGKVDFAAAYEHYEEDCMVVVSVMASVSPLHTKSHLS